jgi:type I restriction enzyme M protein
LVLRTYFARRSKSLSKTKPIRIEEFDEIKKWWNNRTEHEYAYKVSIDTIIEKGYDLDIKNPNKVVEEVSYDRKEIIETIKKNQNRITELITELEQ